jgi:hypothetical protein
MVLAVGNRNMYFQKTSLAYIYSPSQEFQAFLFIKDTILT